MVLRRRLLRAEPPSAGEFEPHNKPTNRGSWNAPTLKELRNVFLSAIWMAIWPPDVVTTAQYSRFLTSRVEGLTVRWQTFRVVAEAGYVITHGLRYDNAVMQVFMVGHLMCVLLHLARRQFWLRWREEICMGMNIMYSTVSFLKIFYLVPRLPNEDHFLFKYCLLYLADAYFCQVPVHKFYRLQFVDASLRWIWWRLYVVMPGAPYVVLIITSLAWQLLLLVFSASLQARHVSAFLRLQHHASGSSPPQGAGPCGSREVVDRGDAARHSLPASTGRTISGAQAIPPGGGSATSGDSLSTALQYRAAVPPNVCSEAASPIQAKDSKRAVLVDQHSRTLAYLSSLRSMVRGRSGYILLEELRGRLARAGPSASPLGTSVATSTSCADGRRAPLGLLRTSVQLFVTATDPRYLPVDWVARLTALVEKGAPGWLVVSASARRGSLVVHLDLVFSPIESCVSAPNPRVPEPAFKTNVAAQGVTASFHLDNPDRFVFKTITGDCRSTDPSADQPPESQPGAHGDGLSASRAGQPSSKPSEVLAQFLTGLEATDVLDVLGLPHDLPAETGKDVIAVQCEEYVKSYRAMRGFRNNVERLVDMQVMDKDGTLDTNEQEVDGLPIPQLTMTLYSNGACDVTNSVPCNDEFSSPFCVPTAGGTSVLEPPSVSGADRIVAFGSRGDSHYPGRQGRFDGNGSENFLLGTYATAGTDAEGAFARTTEWAAVRGCADVDGPVVGVFPSEAGESDAVHWAAFEMREPLDKWLGDPWVNASWAGGLDSSGIGLGTAMYGSTYDSRFAADALPDPDNMELDSYVAAMVPGQPHKLALNLTCCAGVVQQLQVVFRHISPTSYSSGTHLASPAKEIIRTLSSPVPMDSADSHAALVKLTANLNFSAVFHDTPGLVYVELWRGGRRLAAQPVLLAPALAAANGDVGTVPASAVSDGEVMTEGGHEQVHGSLDAGDNNGAGWLQELDEHLRALCGDQGPSAAEHLVEELGGWLAQVAALARGLMQGAIHPTGGMRSRKVARVLRVHCLGGAKASTDFISVPDPSPADCLETASCCNLVPTPPPAPASAGTPSLSASSMGGLSGPLARANAASISRASRAAMLEAVLRDPLLSVLWRLLLVQGRMLLAVAVEAGCVRLAEHIHSMMIGHLSASHGEVLDGALTPVTGLPLLHAAVKSGSIQMLDMVVRWHLQAGTSSTELWLYEAVVQTGGAALGMSQNFPSTEADMAKGAKEYMSVLDSWQPAARASLEEVALRRPSPAALASALFLTTTGATSELKGQNCPCAGQSSPDYAVVAVRDIALSALRPDVDRPPNAAILNTISSVYSPFLRERNEAELALGSPTKSAPMTATPAGGFKHESQCFQPVSFRRRVDEPGACGYATDMQGDQAPDAVMALTRTEGLALKMASSPLAPQERPMTDSPSTPHGEFASLAQAVGACNPGGGHSAGWWGVMSLLSTQAALEGEATVAATELDNTMRAEDGVLVVTPLHIMLVLSDQGRMANHIMESYPEASAAWRDSQSRQQAPSAATRTVGDLCMEPAMSDSLSNHCSVFSTAQLARAAAYPPSTRSDTPCSSTEERAGTGEPFPKDALVSAGTVFAGTQRLRPLARKDITWTNGSSTDFLATVEDPCVAHVDAHGDISPCGRVWTGENRGG